MNHTLWPLFFSFETAKPIMTFKLFKPLTNRGFRFCKKTSFALPINNKAAKKDNAREENQNFVWYSNYYFDFQMILIKQYTG